MANVSMLRSGRLKRIEFPVGYASNAADDGGIQLQVGSQATFQAVDGNANQVFGEISVQAINVKTATQAQAALAQTTGSLDVDIPLQIGQQVFVNGLAFGTATGTFNGSVNLIVQD